MTERNFFRTLLDRIIEGRQRRADAYVANYLATRGTRHDEKREPRR